ncbi:MAG: hypothetical protein RJA70_77 [Pseudomonadota bacterium]|jgi:putative glutamine amidotransferase
MKRLLLSQRVQIDARHGERRDALDQNWAPFLRAAGFLPVPVPNYPLAVSNYFSLEISGVLLTGGNDLSTYGGNAPERDDTERALLEGARAQGLPVLGVCRGMQFLVDHFQGQLHERPGHVATRMEVSVGGVPRNINSYHRLCALTVPDEFEVLASSSDGVVKAARHKHEPLTGIMWHPEREEPFDELDLELFRKTFGEL